MYGFKLETIHLVCHYDMHWQITFLQSLRGNWWNPPLLRTQLLHFFCCFLVRKAFPMFPTKLENIVGNVGGIPLPAKQLNIRKSLSVKITSILQLHMAKTDRNIFIHFPHRGRGETLKLQTKRTLKKKKTYLISCGIHSNLQFPWRAQWNVNYHQCMSHLYL